MSNSYINYRPWDPEMSIWSEINCVQPATLSLIGLYHMNLQEISRPLGKGKIAPLANENKTFRRRKAAVV